MLVAFSGLPGVGKTTLARALADRLGAVYLRIDTIEQELLSLDGTALVERGAGYCVAYAIAGDNLDLGRVVVADSVNPIGVTRSAWRSVAERAGTELVDVMVVCSDVRTHRERIAARPPGARGSSWSDVRDRPIEAPPQEAIVVDTAGRTVEECLAELMRALEGAS
jgi:predicted kinase